MKNVNVCYVAPKVKQSGEGEIAILFILIQREKQYNKHSAWQAHNNSRRERERGGTYQPWSSHGGPSGPDWEFNLAVE